MNDSHPHPCHFRLVRGLDRGWGEMAFEYHWDSTSGVKDTDGSNPDLEHCLLYEFTTYADNPGRYGMDFYFPPTPPFDDWKFRHPTDGRTAPVALGCFAATQGWAWDRHKLGGKLILPEHTSENRIGVSIIARQEYRFHCRVCGHDATLPSSHAGPHTIERTFELRTDQGSSETDCTPIWRYSLRKHERTAWLDLDRNGYVEDSAKIGFGPW